jgi:subtilisin family serine protease
MLSAILALALPKSDAPILMDGMLCHPRRFLLKVEPRALAALPLQGVAVKSWHPEIHVAVVETPATVSQRLKAKIEALEDVLWVSYDRAARLAYTPNDPQYGDMWHPPAIKADKAWDRSFGSDQIVVAVMDTGVRTDHEDLAANIWVNADEVPGNSIDDDGNGYVDDVNGYDFAYGDAIPNDVHGHGTACAGLVAAVQDNNLGVTGIAPRAKIMALKAALDNGFFYDSANIPAYLYAVANGAKIISGSFFSDRVSPAEGEAIKYCWANGVLPIIAAGNDSTVFSYYPAAYDESVAVAALNTNLSKAGFSNHGSWVDVAAPGVSLRTTTANGGYTSSFAGTSGACPVAAGVAALIWGARPSASAQEVRNALEDTATPVNQAPFGEYVNYGIVNAEAAMNAILDSPAPSKSPLVRLVTGLGENGFVRTSDLILPVRIQGRGLGGPETMEVTAGGAPLPIVRRTRDFIETRWRVPLGNPLEVRLDGTLVASIQMPQAARIAYPLAEASTPGSGASVQGGFVEALNEDGVVLKASRRSDNRIVLHCAFGKLRRSMTGSLVLRRKFSGTAVGTETIKLYDWSSASYPYGSFVTLSSGPVPQDMTTSVIPIGAMGRFIDPEGTAYLIIETSNNLPSGTLLELDLMHIASN